MVEGTVNIERFEILEHTADVGLRAFGGDLAAVYENAARGMLSLMVSPASVRPAEEETLTVRGADAVNLLVEWLHEILFRFDARGRVYAEVRVEEIAEWRLCARLLGEAFDPERHEVIDEIKAVTYHAARVAREGNRWVAEVLFDV